jgi:hypothetical protein
VMTKFTQDCHIRWVGMVVIMVVPKLDFEEIGIPMEIDLLDKR